MVQIPLITNWSVFPQNGDIGYFDDMNVWIGQGNTVIPSANASIAKMNEAIVEINNIAENAINAITFDNIAQLKLNSNMGRVDVLGYYTKGDGGGGSFYWDSTSTESDNGGTIIQATSVTTGRWKRNFVGNINVKWFGAKIDGATNDLNSIIKAKNTSNIIYFPKSGNSSTCYIGEFTAGEFDSITFDVDETVTLSFLNNAPYSLYKNINLKNDTNVYFRDIQTNYIFPKTEKIMNLMALQSIQNPTKRIYEALDATDSNKVKALKVLGNTSDSFVDDTNIIRANDSITFTGTSSQYFRGIFIDIGHCETISAYFDNGLAAGAIGVILRNSSGFKVIYTTGGMNNYSNEQKSIGSSSVVLPSISWSQLGQNSYDSYKAENSIFSITKIGNKCHIKLNGETLSTPELAFEVTQVGFVTYNNSQNFTISGLTSEIRTDALVGSITLEELRIFGDSTADGFPISWDKYLRPIFLNSYGVTLEKVTNYAVAGETLSQQYSKMQTVGFGDAYYVAVCAGTNDIQGLETLANFKTTVTNILNYITSNSRKPVVIIPYMWYTRTQSGGIGQNSTNYEKGAKYRIALERLAIQYGSIVIKTTDDLPSPRPSYLLNNNESKYLRDNIHQDNIGYKLYAQAIAKSILDDLIGIPNACETALIADCFKNGTTSSDLRITTDKGGSIVINGTLVITSVVSDTIILCLPRYSRPKRSLNVPIYCLATGGGAMNGIAYLCFETNGNVKLKLIPAGTGVILLSASYASR